MISVLFAYAISNSFSMSVFDVLLDIRELPNLHQLMSVGHYYLTAKDIMTKNFLYLTLNSNFSDLLVLLRHLGPRGKSIPIVRSEENKLLVYTINVETLRKFMLKNYNN